MLRLSRLLPALLLLLSGAPATAADDGPLTGTWVTDEGAMTLSQSGDDVSGNYGRGGEVKGTASGAPLSIPFAGGSVAVHEQVVRITAVGELRPTGFFFGWGDRGAAIALRSPTLTGVAPGEAAIDWAADNDGLRAYRSQDGGATWTPVRRGESFDVTDGSLEFVLVATLPSSSCRAGT